LFLNASSAAPTSTTRVLITGARAPACLEWARLLRRAECAVAVADSTAFPIARFSNCVERWFRLPEPVKGADAYGEALLEAAGAFRADWTVPTCEEAFYIAHQKRRLEQKCRVLVADFALMARVHNKLEFARLSCELAITAPPTRLLDFPDALSEVAGRSRELVFKPIFSRFAAQTLIKPDAKELAGIRPTTAQPWIAQEFVTGRELCSYSILLDGAVAAHACYHPKYRVGQGSGIYLDPVDSHPIQEFVEAFGVVTRYTGQVGFDFIEPGDGRLSVLECNPRATSGIHLFADQGVEIASILNSSGSSLARACPLLATGTPRMVKVAMALFAGPKIRGRAARNEYRGDWRRARDIVSSHEDRVPALAQWLSLGEIYLRAVRLGCAPLAATTADIEWNGQSLGAQP